ncbi:hypothetical protein LXL04_003239 [Taraxacum kok-saghyz]
MIILSAAVGMAAPNLHITTVLFFGFGLWFLWDAYKDGEFEELAEVEDELISDDALKKKKRPLLTQFIPPMFLKAFSIIFFGEWGEKAR